VAGELLYFGSCNNTFRALDARTGRVVWETKLGTGAKFFFHGDFYITPDLVVVGSDGADNSSIYALDRATGRQRWAVPVGRGVLGAISGFGGRVFANTAQGELLGIDVDKGVVRWRRAIKMWAWEGPAVALGRVFAGAGDGSLYALEPDAGRDVWRASLAAPISSSVAVIDGALYAGTRTGMMYRVDPRSGTVLGSLKVDDKLMPEGLPVAAGGGVIVLLANGSADHLALVSLDLGLQRVRWRQTAAGSWTTSRVFIWGDTTVVARRGDITAYCAADGSVAWSRAVQGTVRSFGGSRDTLFAGTVEGSVYALDVPRTCVGVATLEPRRTSGKG
jgi:outer membrane protein assembly factor BamB